MKRPTGITPPSETITGMSARHEIAMPPLPTASRAFLCREEAAACAGIRDSGRARRSPTRSSARVRTPPGRRRGRYRSGRSRPSPEALVHRRAADPDQHAEAEPHQEPQPSEDRRRGRGGARPASIEARKPTYIHAAYARPLIAKYQRLKASTRRQPRLSSQEPPSARPRSPSAHCLHVMIRPFDALNTPPRGARQKFGFGSR